MRAGVVAKEGCVEPCSGADKSDSADGEEAMGEGVEDDESSATNDCC